MKDVAGSVQMLPADGPKMSQKYLENNMRRAMKLPRSTRLGDGRACRGGLAEISSDVHCVRIVHEGNI